MKTRTYQIALAAAIAVCVALAASLAYVLRHQSGASPQAAVDDVVVARGPAVTAQPTKHSSESPAGSEPALASVQLSPRRLQEIGVMTATAEMKNVSQQMNVPGNVDIDEQRLAYVQTRYAGWIQSVFANATYQYVRKGQRLFTIYSPDLVSSEQEYLLAKQNQKRFSKGAHDMATNEGGWLVQAAADRLRQFGVTAGQIADLDQSGKAQHDISVDSPVSGYITERNALPNAYAQPETKLYTIADLSTVWVYANVFQNDVGRLKPGDPAQVTVDAYPGRHFNGRIDQILPQVDLTTRTVRVRLIFSNPGVVLKPGMYVNVAIAAPMGRQLVVPSTAVLRTGSRAIAFIDHGGGNLEPRTIETGLQIGDSVIVLSGLKAGEQVVSSANFLVDSEAQLQAAFGSFVPPAQQPSAASSAAPPSQVQIDLSTQPSPARKGANIVRVKLTGPDGKPLAGAQVSAIFLMPAMPAMGMAAVRVPAALADKGNGNYEGSLQLESEGTWQVTVSVQREGKSIETKHLSINAAGGM